MISTTNRCYSSSQTIADMWSPTFSTSYDSTINRSPNVFTQSLYYIDHMITNVILLKKPIQEGATIYREEILEIYFFVIY